MARPAQDFVFRRRPNGLEMASVRGKVILSPWRTVAGGAGALLTLKQGERVYVDSLVISYTSLVTDAGTTVTVTGIVSGETMTLASLIKTTLLVNLQSQAFSVGVLLDKNISPLVVAANITGVSVTMKYALVNDQG